MRKHPVAIKVMLVDDHAVVRMGFKLLLQESESIQVICEAATGEEALHLYAELSLDHRPDNRPDNRPDVVVMDISMPGMGGLEAVTRLLAKDAAAKILILSAHEDSMHPPRLLKAGAKGYLSKRVAPEELIKAIHEVAAGNLYITPTLAQAMVVQQFSGQQNPVDVLTAREFEVFIALAKGQSVARIATTLFLSPRTVGTHLYNIKQKLNAANSAELTLIALHNGLLEGVY
jgi:two-component system, NarL family, invasion response regulator UvrY